MDASSIGIQNWVCWEPIPQVEVLKVRVLDVGFKPFTPKRKLGVREFPFNWMALSQGWSLCQECVTAYPAHFDVFFFSSIRCVRVTQWVSQKELFHVHCVCGRKLTHEPCMLPSQISTSAQSARFLRQSPSASQSESPDKQNSPLQLRQKPPF